jgi:hypothetical protein
MFKLLRALQYSRWEASYPIIPSKPIAAPPLSITTRYSQPLEDLLGNTLCTGTPEVSSVRVLTG